LTLDVNLTLVLMVNEQEDGLVFIEADPSGSDSWKLEPIVNLLKQGAVGVIPTDTL